LAKSLLARVSIGESMAQHATLRNRL